MKFISKLIPVLAPSGAAVALICRMKKSYLSMISDMGI